MGKALLLVGIGGGLGSIFRYIISTVLVRILPGHYPWGTFFVNVLGCFLIGVFLAWFEKQVPVGEFNLRLLLVTGFCGGFTTFSAFASENIKLLLSGQVLAALVYITGSVLVSLLAVWAGLELVK